MPEEHLVRNCIPIIDHPKSVKAWIFRTAEVRSLAQRWVEAGKLVPNEELLAKVSSTIAFRKAVARQLYRWDQDNNRIVAHDIALKKTKRSAYLQLNWLRKLGYTMRYMQAYLNRLDASELMSELTSESVSLSASSVTDSSDSELGDEEVIEEVEEEDDEHYYIG